MRVLLKIAYDGTDFFGYQVQPNKRTVESELKRCLDNLLGEDVKLVASGRTDSGVHALSQCVHFDTQTKIPIKNIKDALNSVLPSDLRVISSKKVSNDFSARYSCKKKTYRYSCYLSKTQNPLLERYKTLVEYPLDIEKMKEVVSILEGEHDFKCFLKTGSSVKTTVRTIYSIKIVKKGSSLDFYVTGNGFLYNMVRIIVGTLLAVGEGKLDLERVKTALNSGNRTLLGKTASAKGLCLYRVNY